MDTPETATVEVTQDNHLRDMANVGESLMEAIRDYNSHPFMKSWHPADCPSEIVGDLLNALDEATDRTRATRQDGLREADIALLGARMVLDGKATNATGALAKSDWKPSRAHIEGMRNTMREAVEYIDDARAALSDSSTQEESGADPLHDLARMAREKQAERERSNPAVYVDPNDPQFAVGSTVSPATNAGDALREAGWLIERRVSPPQWAVEADPHGVGAFYSDVHRAHRFPSQEAAAEAMRRMSLTPEERAEYFVSEHLFVASEAAPLGESTDPDLGKIEPGHVCKHGVRWPHACEPCDDASWKAHQAALSASPEGEG